MRYLGLLMVGFAICNLLCGGFVMAEGHEKIGIIVVDVQGDFTRFKDGSLAVEGTDEAYVRSVESATKRLKDMGYPIYATQDWHPKEHLSFYTNHKGKKPFDVIKLNNKDQVLWPPHCVQDTPGAEILIDKGLIKTIVKKGMDPNFDSYSGFQDDGGKKTGLDQMLKADGIRKLVIYGIATDYCVKATAVDGVNAGYKVIVVKGLCRGVATDTSNKALEEMKEKGILIIEDLDMEKIKAF